MKNNHDFFEISTSYAKDIKSKATSLLRRRHTDASFTDKSLLPSREEVAKWQTSFDNLLRHKYGVALFRGFLKTEFSDENIEFWLECEDYKYTSKDIKRLAKSKKIYSDYVAIGSPREVNLDIEIRAHTAQNILNPQPDTFERAQRRIQALMEKDSYPRFLESDLYKNLLASAYPPLTSSSVNPNPTPPPTTTLTTQMSSPLLPTNVLVAAAAAAGTSSSPHSSSSASSSTSPSSSTSSSASSSAASSSNYHHHHPVVVSSSNTTNIITNPVTSTTTTITTTQATLDVVVPSNHHHHHHEESSTHSVSFDLNSGSKTS